jgi:selenium-binding protein 1
MMITALSNNNDHSGRTALVEYSDDGKHLATHWMPTEADPNGAKVEKAADGYGYDLRALPRRNVMLSSSFTGWSNYMMDFGKMLQDKVAMERFGQTVVQWNLHTRKPTKVLHVPGAPLEIRFAWGPSHNYAFTSTALTSKLWLIHEGEKGEWQAKAVADIGDPSQVPLPVDISIASDDRSMWVNTFMDGKTRLFDISDPHAPKQIYEKVIGKQINMVSQSWDGKRIYLTSSLLANWDKKGSDNEQFLRSYAWNGKELEEVFSIDFNAEKLGRSHIMVFGSSKVYGG